VYVVTEEVRRYIITGVEHEYAQMLDFVRERNAKIVNEVLTEKPQRHHGIVIYAERIIRKLRRGRTH